MVQTGLSAVCFLEPAHGSTARTVFMAMSTTGMIPAMDIMVRYRRAVPSSSTISMATKLGMDKVTQATLDIVQVLSTLFPDITAERAMVVETAAVVIRVAVIPAAEARAAVTTKTCGT
jgi:hypothetical protein